MSKKPDVGGTHHFYDYDESGQLELVDQEYDHDLAEENYWKELEADHG